MRRKETAQKIDGNRVGRAGYLRAQNFLTQLKRSTGLTYLEKKELWEMAVQGNIDGAYRKYEAIVRGWYGE